MKIYDQIQTQPVKEGVSETWDVQFPFLVYLFLLLLLFSVTWDNENWNQKNRLFMSIDFLTGALRRLNDTAYLSIPRMIPSTYKVSDLSKLSSCPPKFLLAEDCVWFCGSKLFAPSASR
jgi:hypothetical protein